MATHSNDGRGASRGLGLASCAALTCAALAGVATTAASPAQAAEDCVQGARTTAIKVANSEVFKTSTGITCTHVYAAFDVRGQDRNYTQIVSYKF